MKAAVDLLHEARSRERAACLPEAIACFEAAISTAERTGEHAVLAEAQRRRAVEAYRATNDEHGSARAYVNLGIAHTDLRQYDWADSYFSMSSKIAERAGDPHLQGMCLVNHAEAHFARGRYEQALRNAESALAIFDRLDSRSDKSEAYKMI